MLILMKKKVTERWVLRDPAPKKQERPAVDGLPKEIPKGASKPGQTTLKDFVQKLTMILKGQKPPK